MNFENDEVNFSTLKIIDKNPAAYLHALLVGRPDTLAMKLGRAVHCAVLEPERFAREYIVYQGDRRGNAWRQFLEDNGGKEILRGEEMTDVAGMAESARKAGADLLVGGEAEKTVRWTDEKTGIACRGRLDYLAGKRVVDLKTCRLADPRAFERESWRMLYHAQMAFYVDGTRSESATIIAVEKEPPYIAQVYHLSDELLEYGREKYSEMLETLKRCRETNEWPGYSTRPLELCQPAWVARAEEDSIDGLGLDFTDGTEASDD